MVKKDSYICFQSFLMKSVVIFCGSGSGNNPVYVAVAKALGESLAKRNIAVVYGGATVGIMGVVADATMQAGGVVTGIIPEFLATREIAHMGITELITVQNMHERKLLMHDRSDAVIALPGGWGTMEELFEMLTWAQLGLHQKPIGLLNVNGYYDTLIALCDHMVVEGFLNAQYRGMLIASDTIDNLLALMDNYQPTAVAPLLTESTT